MPEPFFFFQIKDRDTNTRKIQIDGFLQQKNNNNNQNVFVGPTNTTCYIYIK